MKRPHASRRDSERTGASADRHAETGAMSPRFSIAPARGAAVQAAVNQSPYILAQRRAMATLFGDAVPHLSAAPMQCKANVVQMVTPLVTDKLNVVGENHDETEVRLDREKRYTAAHAGASKYWSESEFRVRAYSAWHDFWHDKRAFADPFELRFNNAQQFLSENARIIGQQGNANNNSVKARDDLNVQQKFISNLWINLYNLSSGFIDAQADGFEVPAKRRTEMLGYRQQIKNIAVTWQAARVALATARGDEKPPAVFDWTDGGVAVTSEANPRANFVQSVADLSALNIVARTVNELSQDRSAAMHVAANNRHTELGVWKVGDEHRRDMARYQGIQYNLVSLAAFNADYNTWSGE